MNSAMSMDAQFLQNLGVIAQSEEKFRRLVKYVKRLAEPKADPTLMSREEFFARLDRGEEEYRQGKCTRLLPGESVTSMLRRSGYDI